jgi:hypothetical protein
MNLTREKIHQALLLTLNDSSYNTLFPQRVAHHYISMGYTTVTDPDSNIAILFGVLSKFLEMQLGHYRDDPPEPKPLTRTQKRAAEKARVAKEKADRERFDQLEKAWKEDEPRAHQEMLDNAEKAAQNIFNKNQELKKDRK